MKIEIKSSSDEFQKGYKVALRMIKTWLIDNKDRPSSDLLELLEHSEQLEKLLRE